MIIIINSPLFKHRNDLYDEDSLPPIGLGYIATNLKNCGHDVELIDAIDQRLPLASLLEILNTKKPAFIASNIFTTNYDLVKELFESISFPTHIIIGGLSTKQLYSKIMEWATDNPIDIVTGDGERITTAIVENQIDEQPVFINGNKRVFQINASSKYLVENISDVSLDRSFFLNEPVIHPLGFFEANIVASRGCIYNCTFCAAARSLNADYPVRERDEASLIKEVQDIIDRNPDVDSIRVLDDLFLKNNLTVQKAISVFKNFKLKWRSMAHVMTFKNVDDKMMNELKESGCSELFIGIESGSPAILSSINKTKNVDTILNNLTKVLKAGINMKGYFIYGFPEETEADMEMTFKLAEKLRDLSIEYGVNFRTSVFQYRPYHGTQIYHDLEEKGYNLAVQQVEPNQALSALVGRLQFNFHSGNYSNVDFNTVHDYIYRTINLNGGQIFPGHKEETQLQKQHL